MVAACLLTLTDRQSGLRVEDVDVARVEAEADAHARPDPKARSHPRRQRVSAADAVHDLARPEHLDQVHAHVDLGVPAAPPLLEMLGSDAEKDSLWARRVLERDLEA